MLGMTNASQGLDTATWEQGSVTCVEIVIQSSDWDEVQGGGYTYTKTFTSSEIMYNLTSNSRPIIGFPVPSGIDTWLEIKEYRKQCAKICLIESGAHSLTFTCFNDCPNQNVTVSIKGTR